MAEIAVETPHNDPFAMSTEKMESGEVEKGAKGNTDDVHPMDHTGSGGNRTEDKKVFVGGISWETTEKDLKEYFEKYGEVSHIQIKYDPLTGRSRGFAFVEFANGDVCASALKQKDHEIRGKMVEVKRAKHRENKKVFVGGIAGDFPEDELRRHFEQFGRVEDVEWPFDRQQQKRRNFAFVVFEEEEAAERACAQAKHRFGERLCDVKKATPQQRLRHVGQGYGGAWAADQWGYGGGGSGTAGGSGGGGSGSGGGYGYEDYYSGAADYYGAYGAGGYDWQGYGGYGAYGYDHGGSGRSGGRGGRYHHQAY